MKSRLQSPENLTYYYLPSYSSGYSRLKYSLFKRRIKLEQIANVIINDMKISRNDNLMVYISSDCINAIDSQASDLVHLLKMIIGTGGTLLMPAVVLKNDGEEDPVEFACWGKLADSFSGYQYNDRWKTDEKSLLFKLFRVKARVIGIGLTLSDILASDDINRLTDDGKSTIPDHIFKHFEEDERCCFKKNGFPFFILDIEKAYSKIGLPLKDTD